MLVHPSKKAVLPKTRWLCVWGAQRLGTAPDARIYCPADKSEASAPSNFTARSGHHYHPGARPSASRRVRKSVRGSEWLEAWLETRDSIGARVALLMRCSALLIVRHTYSGLVLPSAAAHTVPPPQAHRCPHSSPAFYAHNLLPKPTTTAPEQSPRANMQALTVRPSTFRAARCAFLLGAMHGGRARRAGHAAG